MMLELLKKTISGDALNYWSTLPGETQKKLCRVAEDKNIAAYFYYFFNQNLPAEFVDKFRGIYQANRAVALKNEFFQKELFELLFRNQIRFAPLKGCDLAVNYYPDPALRPYTDWDILVHVEDVSGALQLLETHGWAKTVPAKKYEKVTYHHLPPLKKNNILLELHRNLPGFADRAPEYVWQYISRAADGRGYDLSPELKLAMLIGHFAVDDYLHTPFVKFIIDAGWLLKKETVDPDKLRKISQAFSVPFPGDILGACPDFFDAELLEKIGFDRQKAAVFRKIFEYQNELNQSPGAEWVVNRPDKYSWKWWQTRLQHLKPSAIQKTTVHPEGKITPVTYLAAVCRKIFSFIGASRQRNRAIAEYYKLVASVKPPKK